MVFPARRFSLIQQHMGYSPFCLFVGQQGNEKVNVNNFSYFYQPVKVKRFQRSNIDTQRRYHSFRLLKWGMDE